jgi:hypothetical protein
VKSTSPSPLNSVGTAEKTTGAELTSRPVV